MRSKGIIIGVLFSLVMAVAAGAAQEVKEERIMTWTPQAAAPIGAPMDHVIVFPDGQAGGQNTFAFLGSEPPAESKVVKGVPYSAEGVTEIVRTLADGNRIVRRNTALIYRDSEGRVRREQTLGALGPWAAEGNPPKTISIFDPVDGLSFSTMEGLEAGTAAHAGVAGAAGAPGAPVAEPVERKIEVKVARPAGIAPHAARVFTREMPAPVVESLGTQVMEGLQVEGTRSTVVIPAGEIGNEQPIQTVSETWFSPELQTIVFSRHNDPLVGETTFRLTNIVRSEPDPELFRLPAGVKIQEGREGRTIIHKIREK